MEAKDTLRTYNELKAYCEEKGIALPIQPDDLKLAAAEISFKAGQKEERDSWYLKSDPEKARDAFTKDIILRARAQAIREVVEWIKQENDKNPQILDGSFIIAKLNPDRWQAKLKEWNNKEVK